MNFFQKILPVKNCFFNQLRKRLKINVFYRRHRKSQTTYNGHSILPPPPPNTHTHNHSSRNVWPSVPIAAFCHLIYCCVLKFAAKFFQHKCRGVLIQGWGTCSMSQSFPVISADAPCTYYVYKYIFL